jgi:hypothetical protein
MFAGWMGGRAGFAGPRRPGHNRVTLALNILGRKQVRHMPSLIRFLLVVGVLGAVVYGGLYAMAVFFEPEPKETSTTVQGVRIPR